MRFLFTWSLPRPAQGLNTYNNNNNMQEPLMLNSAVFQKSLYYLYNDTYMQHYEAVDRTMWRTRFGGTYGPVVRLRNE
jgi:hypothetical protein